MDKDLYQRYGPFNVIWNDVFLIERVLTIGFITIGFPLKIRVQLSDERLKILIFNFPSYKRDSLSTRGIPTIMEGFTLR